MPLDANDRVGRAVVLSPVASDAAVTAGILRKNGIGAEVCPSVGALVEWIEADIGILLVAEEALSSDTVDRIAAVLQRQPAWSDLPVLVLTGYEGAAARPRAMRLHGVERLGNITLLERPLRVHELVSAVHTAMRARRRQFQVRDLVDETQEAVRARDRFLAMLGHELRNPLAAIAFALRLDRDVQKPRGTRHEQTVDRQMAHLSRLVDDLLDVGRVTSGKVTLAKSPLDVRAAIRRVLQSLESKSAQHAVRVELPDAPLTIDGDPVRIEQILSNVITNAFKYTPAGGRVTVSATQDGDSACVTVTDDGMGMAPGMLEKVFVLFEQVPSTLDRARGGLGIGLTLARSLVEMHGGTIEAESAGLGRGSAFRIRIPLSTGAERAPSEDGAAARNAGGAPARRVLIVEDNADIRGALQELLVRKGHDVTTAVNGKRAIESAHASLPEIAILDIGLPDIDGYGVARAIRKKDRNRSVLLIAMTGYGQPEDRERAHAAGFDRHMTKPVDLDQLLALIEGATRANKTPRRRTKRAGRRSTASAGEPRAGRGRNGR